MKTFVLLIILLLDSVTIFSQKWEKMIGYPNRYEWPNDIIEYYDKGYYIAGGYMAGQIPRPWDIKTDINGESLWDKSLINPPELAIFAVTSDSSGNIYVCGRTTINNLYCPLVAKFDPCGETVWCKMFHDNYFTIEGCFLDILINKNNEIILLALVQNEDQVDQIFLFGYSIDGDYLWKNVYASKDDYPLIASAAAYSIVPFKKDYIISGFCYWPFPDDPLHVYQRALFISIDSLFNEKWILPFYCLDSVFGKAYTTIPISDSILMGIGIRRTYGLEYYTMLMFYNAIGVDLKYDQINNEQIGTGIISNDMRKIQRIDDNLFLVSGYYEPDYNDFMNADFVIDTSAIIYKSLLFQNVNGIPSLIKTSDEKYLIACTYEDINNDVDIYLYKIDNFLEMVPFDTNQYTYDSLCPEPIPSGTINLGDCDLITDIGEIPSPQEYYEGIKKIPIIAYPNPAETKITLAFQNTKYHTNMLLECYNIYGQQVHTEKIWKGQLETKIDLRGWASGLYFAVVKSEGKLAGTGRFVRK